MYYRDKIGILKQLFGTDDLAVEPHAVVVGETRYPILDDVIILLPPDQYTRGVREAVRARSGRQRAGGGPDDGDIQSTFGEEWQAYEEILPEHEREFRQYFDLVDVTALRGARICDLGCGNGRWSYFLKDRCRELVLVDFSDAIFVARRNLAGARHALFFMGDLRALPFAKDCCDLLVCVGVLHHLPAPCLDAVRALRSLAPRLLVFLYYALDNRPAYFRWCLRPVTWLRRVLWRVEHPRARKVFSFVAALALYRPLVGLGKLLRPLRLARHVPLYEFYSGKSLRRLEQDVYDRFFTRIEQRVSRQDILGLRDTFSQVIVSDHLPYWHFLCVRRAREEPDGTAARRPGPVRPCC